mmetsp:Transcript_30154/g.56824  ORF Transcript_30154/g.56824 Transcript_30154/m.56824 type:complete len:276 (-) Transcript_30154:372-1199(-)
MPPNTGNFTTNDGVDIAYTTWGTDGPAVVLVHGWSGSRHFFRDSVQSLSRKCRVFAFDLRGHGESGKPSWGAHVARLAADLRDFLVAMNLSSVTGVGTSLGCAVLWSYLELFGQQDRLARCVFVDQAPLQYKFEGDWEHGSNGCYNAECLAGLRARLLTDLAGCAKDTVKGCMQRPTPEQVDFFSAETLKADGAFLGALMADHTQLDWRPLLPKINLPCLVMVGRKSQCFPWQGVQYVADNIPGAQAIVFEEGDHWLYIEEPDRFADAVLDFVLK